MVDRVTQYNFTTAEQSTDKEGFSVIRLIQEIKAMRLYKINKAKISPI